MNTATLHRRQPAELSAFALAIALLAGCASSACASTTIEPVAGAEELITPRIEPVAGAEELITPRIEPVAAAEGLITPRIEPVAAEEELITPRIEPVAAEEGLITPALAIALARFALEAKFNRRLGGVDANAAKAGVSKGKGVVDAVITPFVRFVKRATGTR